MIKITPEEFEFWAAYIYELTGIVLAETKSYLIENRLQDLLNENESNNFKDLYLKCKYTKDKILIENIINRISTQETSFFRDAHVYKAIKSMIQSEILPEKRRSTPPGRNPQLRIWSAACSHGQEPYSISMVLSETIPDLDNWDVQILATDIADNAFRKASLGRYSELEVKRGLDDYHRQKYFVKRDNNQWQVSDRIRALLSFRKINLVTDSFISLGSFDIILCRNVAIYFDHETKIKLFNKLEKALASEGRLIIGATENLSQITDRLKPVHKYSTVFYIKADSTGGQDITEIKKGVFTRSPGLSTQSAPLKQDSSFTGKPQPQNPFRFDRPSDPTKK